MTDSAYCHSLVNHTGTVFYPPISFRTSTLAEEIRGANLFSLMICGDPQQSAGQE
jgi:hypothetical protein